MKFQIESVDEHGHQIVLSKDTDDRENVYTMLVGRNASGKSRLLGKITNHYIFNRYDPYSSIFPTFNSSQSPRQVVVISNSRYDKFPDPARSGYGKTGSSIPYHYLASGSERHFSPYKVLSSAFSAIIDLKSRRGNKEEELFRILDYIGFLPSCSFELRRTIVTQNFNDEYSKNTRIIPFDQEELGPDFQSKTRYLNSLLRENRSISVRLDDFSGWQADTNIDELRENIPSLIAAGLIRISRLTLYNKKTKDKVLFHQASSGQQCMLLLFLGLSGVMKNGSLVCIDEPEISLHPKWQAEFIGLLQETFARYRGCHFLIATHSPQIVSGLTSENGFVADLERNDLLRPSDYAKKSADFQLSEVFHEPGYKNEYLIRTLLVMLSKVSKNERLSTEDRRRIRSFEALRHRLDEADPVCHLLDQIKIMAG